MSVAAPSHGVESLAQPQIDRASKVASIGLPLLLTAVSFLLWGLFLRRVDLSKVDDLGLISALPREIVGALGLFIAGFMLTVYQKRVFVPLALLQLVLWIFMLHGLTALLSPEPDFNVAWRHTGIIDYILRNRSIDPTIDAYFSWPGFFGWSALLTKMAGFSHPVSLIRWAPLIFNLLYLPPLTLLVKSVVRSEQTLWLALWFFYTASWVGQDYLSPQAMAFFAYLLVLGILLKWFVTQGSPKRFVPVRLLRKRRRAERPAPSGDGPVSGELSYEGGVVPAAVLVLVFAATVSSHQLTPFAILAAVTALVFAGRCKLRGLPVLLAVILGSWTSYMTVHFLAGHLKMAFGPAGIQGAAATNVAGRMQGSPKHLVVVYTRMGMTAAVWALAAWGALRARRTVRPYFALWILALAPFPLLVLQSYGGEMLLRIYVLTLPFAALFIALLFSTSHASLRRRVWTGMACVLTGLALVGGFLVSRYGNHVIDQVKPGEVEAVAHLYEMAPKGTTLLAGDSNLPWKYRDYETHRYKELSDYKISFADDQSIANSVARAMSREGNDTFLIITQGQKRTVELLGVPVPARESTVRAEGRPDWLTEVETALESSPKFEMAFKNRDASIFVLAEQQG